MVSLSASGINLTLIVDGDQVLDGDAPAAQRVLSRPTDERDCGSRSSATARWVGRSPISRAERGFVVTTLVGASDNANGDGDHARTRWATPTWPSSSPSPTPRRRTSWLRARAGYPSSSGPPAGTARLDEVRERGNARRAVRSSCAELFDRRESLPRDCGERRRGSCVAAPSSTAHIVETHHAAKKDAPSGTAIALERAVATGLGTAHPHHERAHGLRARHARAVLRRRRSSRFA